MVEECGKIPLEIIHTKHIDISANIKERNLFEWFIKLENKWMPKIINVWSHFLSSVGVNESQHVKN